MNSKKKTIPARIVVKTVERVAREKSGLNCWGLLYEPKRPEALVKKSDK
ncbi:MAG: cyclic lactone autoinducer peptide [Coprococcus sp.]|nr:cyclic lactone autoinducer peptide [Coprococcus sp.]